MVPFAGWVCLVGNPFPLLVFKLTIAKNMGSVRGLSGTVHVPDTAQLLFAFAFEGCSIQSRDGLPCSEVVVESVQVRFIVGDA